MLRAIYGFDHCLKFPNPAAAGTFADWWSANSWDGAGLGLNLGQCAIDQDGWLGAYTNNTNQIVTFSLAGYVPANPTKLTIGFRIKTLVAYASSHSIIHLTAADTPQDIACYLFLAGSGSAPWLTGIGKEYYAEFTYDFAAGTVAGLIDGVAIAAYTPPAMAAANKAAWAAGNGLLNFRLGSSTSGRYAIRDVYVLDAVAGDGMTGPVGPQRMYPVIPDVATGTGWTVSSGVGTLLDALVAAPPSGVTANSPANKAPLTMSLKTTAPAGTKINAVSLGLNGYSQGDAASITKVEISQGATNLAAKFVPFQRGAQNFAPVGVYPKAPDGTAWSVSNIDATAIKLTPDTAA